MEAILPPLPVNYLDFTLWQQEVWQESLMEQQSQWWQQQLDGLEPLNLPLDYPRPQQFDYRGQRCDFTLTKALSGQLQQLAREQQTTLYTVMLSAFALLLSRYSGQDDLAVGSPIANRHHPQLESLVGFFANTLVVRTVLNPDDSFSQLVAQVHSTVTDMQQYQEIPFEQLVEQLDVERDPSRTPLFQVLFAVQNFNLSGHWSDSDSIHPMPVPDRAATAKFDLSLIIDDSGDQYTAMLEYPVALFRASTIERLWQHYVRVLEQVVAQPNSQLQDISLLTPDEYQQMVVDWNRTDTDIPAGQQNLLLHQLFEQQAQQSPDTICLIFEDQQLTNQQVNSRANQLALTIQEQIKESGDGTIPPETCVVVCCEPGPEINIAALAVLKAGCVYVPVNHDEAPQRIRYILNDTAAPLVLTTSWLLADDSSFKALALDLYPWSDATPLTVKHTVTPETLAYVIYTSGTTGKPKGVMVAHSSAVSRIQTHLSDFSMSHQDIILQKIPHGFDPSILEIFWGMAAPAANLIASREARRDPQELHQVINHGKVSIAMFAPDALAALQQWLHGQNQVLPASLRLIIIGGQVLSAGLVNRIRAVCNHTPCVVNVYGPAEAVITSTAYQCPVTMDCGPVPIGRPLPQTQVFVLDSHGQPLPTGIVGELCIGGKALARGYLHQPELTRTAFVSNSFASPEDHRLGYDRLYRTGDRVQWLDSGELMFIGRTDQQIKIRGFRVEPAEIEQCIESIAGIRQAVVLPRSREATKADDGVHYDYLVAWCVAEESLDVSSLRQQLRQKLPTHMVPAAYVPVDHFPVTVNGKLDTKALPEPQLHIADDYVAPTDATETRLCQLWQSALAVAQVGIHDNFFHLGGDSLLAIRLCQQISNDLSLDAPVALLFRHPTVAELAPQLTRQMSLIPPRALDHGPMSFAQQRLWFIEQFEQGTSAYHIPLLLRLASKTDSEQLIRALELLTVRHPVLRTRFFMNDDGLRIQQVGQVRLRVDLREVAPEELDNALAQVINTPFDLSQTYPLRVVMFSTGEDQVLLLLFHHIAVDGWSMNILCRELAHLCQAAVKEQAVMETILPPLTIDYLDFTLWQQATWQESLMEQQSQWWQQQLSGLEPLNLPLDYPRPQQFDYRGQRCQFTLTKTLSGQLQQLAREQQTTLYTVMLSAFALLLSRYSGQDDLAVGSPIANRHHPQLESLVGFFANTLVMRTVLNPDDSFCQLVAQVHSTVTDMQQYQEIPFEQLVEQLDVERDPSRTPLFQVLFAVQNFNLSGHWSDSDSIHPMPVPDRAATAKFDLSLIIDDSGDQYTAMLEYPVALFRSSTIERLWQHYVRVLEQVVAQPDSQLQDISLLTPDEYQQIVVDWNRTDANIPAEQQNLLLHQLFEQQAQQSPDTICLIFEDQQLTNQQVDSRANQLALTIQEQIKESSDGTIPPETCVVVCCEPGLEINIAALAVLMAGCVYVPVNHNEAPERIGFILNDTRTPLVLTTAGLQPLFNNTDKAGEHSERTNDTVDLLLLDRYPWSDQQTIKLLSSNITPQSLAYIVYTSGTTGAPKGVMLEHGAVVIRMLDSLRRFAVSHQDVFLQRTAHGFDVSIIEMFWSMATRGATVIASESARLDPSLLLQVVAHSNVSIALFVPSMLEVLLLELTRKDQKLPDALRLLICAGESLPQTLVNRLYQQGSNALRIVNAYGPSETAVATINNCTSSTSSTLAPIGKPLINTQVYVLDHWQRPVSTGIPGELYIGGAGLSRGYLNRPELTNSQFAPVSLRQNHQTGRVYKTGDLVKWLDSGELQFIARTDQQIKIHGFRIEPGETEQCLERVEGIHKAVVLPRSRRESCAEILGHYDYLVAWYIADQTIDEAAIQQQLSQKLPAYMVPVAYIRLDCFPVTANGKLDTRALPEPKRQITEDYVAPASATEARLCQLWQSLLAIEQVGIHDNFFHLGGDSMLAIRLCQQISDALSVDAPVALLFQYPTVAGLAPQLTGQISLIPARGLDHGPMSFAQQRLWFIEQFEQGTSAYHIPLLFRITGTGDRELLIRAMQQLAIRHPSLRTRFFINDQGLRIQQVGGDALTVERRQTLPDELGDALAKIISTPFNLERNYPLRVALFSTGEYQVLLLLFHHIAVDGWSLDILCRELATLYQAGLRDQAAMEAILPPLPVNYLDFTLWQQEVWQESLMEQQSQWWQQQLDGLEPLNLPLDYARPQQFDYRGQRCEFALTKAMSGQLQQLAREQQTTLYTVMLSAFALLLSRYSGQDDLAVGSPIANRHHPQLESLVGFFANTLVVRTVLNPDDSFCQLVAQVHSTVTDMQQYQEIPFEQLVEQLDVERDPSRTPLFQVLFAVQHFALTDCWSDSDSIHLVPVPDRAATAKFDLSLIIDDSGDQYTAMLEYPVALFRASTIERLWQHYVRVLEQVVAQPTIRLRDISLLTPDEYQQMVVDWNQTDTDIPAEQQNLLLHQLFEQQAQQSPDTICLIFEDQQLTNQEVNCRANQLALTIQEQIKESGDGTIPPETCVVVCCEPGPEINIAALAVLKAGCVYVPVNHDEAPQRIHHILNDTAAPLVLTTSRHSWLLASDTSFKALALDLYPWSDATQSTAELTTPETLAYIIYTSGTTGEPKGVMTTHRAFVNRIRDTLARFPTTAGDVFIQKQPHGFDFSLWELFWHMGTASPAVIASQDSRYDPKLLVNILKKHAVTILMAVPSSLKAWCDWLTGQNRTLPQSLRLVISGAESLNYCLFNQLIKLAPNHAFTLFNAYGPSEASVYATVHQLCEQRAENNRAPIGSPASNTRLYVLDNSNQPLPVGVPGELYIGGIGLARGYLHRPDLTGEAFVNNPFSSAEDRLSGYDRLYRTGDLVQWLDNGELLYIGRKDQQVKNHGFRIEPGEVERCLETIEGIRQAVVMPRSRQATPADKTVHYDYLVAWYLAEQPLEETTLREQLSQKLPAYMVPAAYVPVDHFPVTVNGKLDTKALPEPQLHITDDYVAPTNATETRLCQLWQSALVVEQVGIHDNFFHLGGDSLLAIRLCQQISNDLSLDAPVALLFRYPTVAELAPQLTRQISPIPPRELDHGPMSSAQQRLWFIEQYEQGTAAYHIPMLFRLARAADAEKLIAALKQLAIRHPVLRTRFLMDESGHWVQHVSQDALATEHREVAQDKLDDTLADIINTPFDLSGDYPLRVVSLAASESRVILLLCHHIAVDGWSLEILIRELVLLYENSVTNTSDMEALLPPPDIDYLDFTLWQQNTWEPTQAAPQIQWWQKQLAGLEPLNLPLDYPRPRQFDYRGQRCQFTLTTALSGQLQQLARAQQTTLYTVMLSAFALLLSRYSGQDDLAVGSPIANRYHPQLDCLVGLFANTPVVRTQLNPEHSFTQLLSRVHSTVTDMQQYQAVPFERLVKELCVERAPSHTPLFQVMFAVQHFKLSELWQDIDTIQLEPLLNLGNITKFDLALGIDNGGEPFTGCIEYRPALFRAATIHRLVQHYLQILEQVVSQPAIRLRDISLLTAQEYRQIVVDWNDTDSQLRAAQESCLLHHLFEQQAEQSPDDICLIFGNQQLTNREVNNRANQLAVTIREHIKGQCSGTVPPETCVVVCCGPGPEINIAAQAVLKAGCVYVPVNHKEAPERIRFILRDSKTPLILTTSHNEWLLSDNSSYCALALDTFHWTGTTTAISDITTTPDKLAYIIYSSDIAGTPRGIMVSHEAAVIRIETFLLRFAMSNTDVLLQQIDHGFSLSIMEIFWGMAAPAITVIASGTARHDPKALLQSISKKKVTVAIFVPDALTALQQWIKVQNRNFPSNLRLIIIGGQALSADVMNQTRQLCDHKPCIAHVYGPAEAVIATTSYESPAPVGNDPIPIGRPLPTTQTFVLDSLGQLLPAGISGELYIGGKALARGYQNQPDLTEAAFVRNPFASSEDGHSGNGRLYRTGDRVKWLDNGELLYLGRMDRQIKIRGFRIEPSEIEQCLKCMNGIRQAIVQLRSRQQSTAGTGDDYLVAWYTAEQPLDDTELREQLKLELPSYMVPEVYVPMDSANGQLDAAALPEPELQLAGQYAPPANATEDRLCQLWQSLLRVERVGIHDNFFQCGGDSLMAVKLCQMINRVMPEELPLSVLFQQPTVSELARFILRTKSDLSAIDFLDENFVGGLSAIGYPVKRQS